MARHRPRNISSGPAVLANFFSSSIPFTISAHSSSRSSFSIDSPLSTWKDLLASSSLPIFTSHLGLSGTKNNPTAKTTGTMRLVPSGIWYDDLSSCFEVALFTAAPMMLPMFTHTLNSATITALRWAGAASAQ